MSRCVLVSLLLCGAVPAQVAGPQHPELKRLEFMLGETTGKGSKPYDNGLTGPLVYRLTFEQKEKELQLLAETKMGEAWTKAIEGVYVQKR